MGQLGEYWEEHKAYKEKKRNKMVQCDDCERMEFKPLLRKRGPFNLCFDCAEHGRFSDLQEQE